MEQMPPQPPAADPDNVPEIICDGRFNVTTTGPLATITFTHERPDPVALLDHSRVEMKSVVRARIVMRVENLNALRELLNQIISVGPTTTPTTKTH